METKEPKKKGRKPSGEPQRSNALFLRMRPDALAAVEEHLAKLNEERERVGLARLPKASWAHDMILEGIGRHDLTLAGRADAASHAQKRVLGG